MIDFDKVRQEQIRQERIKAEAIEQAPLVKELNELGYKLRSLFDLSLVPGQRYASAIPVLMRHIERQYSQATKDAIYRKFAGCKGMKSSQLQDVIEMLFRHFEAERNDDLRWTIGLALGYIVRNPKYLERLGKLLKEKKYGESRGELVIGYARTGKQEVIGDLISFLSDRDLMQHAIVELGRLKAKEAKPHLEALRNHENPLFRDLVRKALRKIG
ncbi:MAG: HEAT repeat domain-containing protein [Gammaproteobacteria bacterium]|nr:HEAT repeat domain-containing protein [Gammaproteobacteria bacterium]